MPIPKLVHQPAAHQALARGIAALVSAIRPTLGPLPRKAVAWNQNKIELLDDAGLIARRIIALPNRTDDVGAMLLRQTLWQVRQHVGDGAATTAVLYESIVKQGLRFIAAGVDPMPLRASLQAHLPPLTDALLNQAQILSSPAELESIAFTVCGDEEMAAVLSHVVDAVGRYGQVDIRAGHGRGMNYTFVEGPYWIGGVLSKEMLRGGPRNVAELENPAILLTDMHIEEPRELVPLMRLALRDNIKALLLIVKSISDTGLSVVLDDRLRGKIHTIVVKLDALAQKTWMDACQDIVLLTGGRPLLSAAGQTLNEVVSEDFGYARWVWADDKHFGFASGRGDPIEIRRQARKLRTAHERVDDDDIREGLLARLGKLNGGSATVMVGGLADDEIKGRKAVAERTIRALRLAMSGGVIPGGGLSLLNCGRGLLNMADGGDSFEERAARHILASALSEPMRALLENAGYEAGEVLAQLEGYPGGHGFDVMRGELVNIAEAGIYDVAQVQAESLRRAVMSAGLALTIDAMVLHREPETMTEP